ncbi:sigma-70 family RNA polymerase sigma factor [Clostridium sp. KNHs214]|uniref:RNA polymerase sigma factor n=1 Tax=Clostridium sp. KNHs214 TaxID=1540257 RepID=UPI00055076DE|nr:sigma-70 family RNA polymerase sigma factor [Clostridium sp. KNHs214]
MIKYEFATGEVIEIEVPAEVEEVIIEIEKIEYNKNRAETRRHNSIADMEEQGFQFKDKSSDIEAIAENNEELKALYAAMDKLLPQQQELIKKVYFEEKSLTEIAREEGINKSSVHKRLERIKGQLKKYLD